MIVERDDGQLEVLLLRRVVHVRVLLPWQQVERESPHIRLLGPLAKYHKIRLARSQDLF